MLGESLAKFLAACGRRVEVACGVYWAAFRPGSRLYFALPDQVEIGEDDGEVGEMLRRVGGLKARYATTAARGAASGVYVLPLRGYDLANLDRKTRNRIRRGLERCEIRPLGEGELREQALRLNRETLARQQREAPEFSNAKAWSNLVDRILRIPAIRATGAFFEGELASYALDCHEDGWVYGLHQFSRDDLREHCPNHALEYEIGRRAAEEGVAVAMTNSTVPLRGGDGLHDFKVSLGYRVVPRRVTVRLHPALHGLATSRLGLAALRVAGRLAKPESPTATAATILTASPAAERGYGSSSGISKKNRSLSPAMSRKPET